MRERKPNEIYPGVKLSKEALYFLENQAQYFDDNYIDSDKLYYPPYAAREEAFNELGELLEIPMGKLIDGEMVIAVSDSRSKYYKPNMEMLLTRYGEELARADGFLQYDLDLDSVMQQSIEKGRNPLFFKDYVETRNRLKKDGVYGKVFSSHPDCVRPKEIKFFQDEIAQAEGRKKHLAPAIKKSKIMKDYIARSQ